MLDFLKTFGKKDMTSDNASQQDNSLEVETPTFAINESLEDNQLKKSAKVAEAPWKTTHYCTTYDDDIGMTWFHYKYAEHTRDTVKNYVDEKLGQRFEIAMSEIRRGEPDQDDVEFFPSFKEITLPSDSTVKDYDGSTINVDKAHFIFGEVNLNKTDKRLPEGEVSLRVNIFNQDEKTPHKTITFSASQEVLKSNLYEIDELGEKGDSLERRLEGYENDEENTYYCKGKFYPRKADTELWEVKAALLKNLSKASKNIDDLKHDDSLFVLSLLEKNNHEILKAPQNFQNFLLETGAVVSEEQSEITKPRRLTAKETAQKAKIEAFKKETIKKRKQKSNIVYTNMLKNSGINK